MTSREPPAEIDLSQSEREELGALLSSLADGNLCEAEERRLRAILDHGEPARRVFREFATLHAGLYWDYATLLAPALPPPSGPRRNDDSWRPPIHRAAAVFMAAAVAAAATIAAWMLIANPAGWLGQAAGGDALATVTATKYLQPTQGHHHLAIGQRIEAGRISLAAGALELTLRNGVVVVFEGPGDFDLIGELAATLNGGNLVVRPGPGDRRAGLRRRRHGHDEPAAGIDADAEAARRGRGGTVFFRGQRRAGAARFPAGAIRTQAAGRCRRAI